MELLQHRRDDHAQLLEELFACGRHVGLIGHRNRHKTGQLRGQWRVNGVCCGSEMWLSRFADQLAFDRRSLQGWWGMTSSGEGLQLGE